MYARKLIASVALSLALAFGASAQTAPDAGTAPQTATTAPAPKKASKKKTKASKKKKKKGAPTSRKAREPATSVVLPAAEAIKVPEDNEPPVLTHTAVTSAKKGKPLTITANAIDQSGVFGPIVYLRKKGLADSEYIPMRMSASGTGAAGDYTLVVPAALVSAGALEYYIEAWDDAGNGPARAGSPESPFLVNVEEEKKIVVKAPTETAAPAIAKQTDAPPAGARTTVLQANKEQSRVPIGEAPVIVPTTQPPTQRPLEPLARSTLIGIGVDAGVPGGGGFTLLVRPLWWLRLNAGLAYNYFGFGYRGGLSFAPCWCAVTPTLNLDAGHYLSGDLNKVANPTDANVRTLLSHVTYTFATAQLGLEFGSQRWFNFYLRGGITYFESSFSGADLTALAQGKIVNDPSTTYKAGDGKISSVAPCVSLGFNVFVY